jgi:hypothetical protein
MYVLCARPCSGMECQRRLVLPGSAAVSARIVLHILHLRRCSSSRQIDEVALMDSFRHSGLITSSPWCMALLQADYTAQPRRAKRNYERLRSNWKGAHAIWPPIAPKASGLVSTSYGAHRDLHKLLHHLYVVVIITCALQPSSTSSSSAGVPNGSAAFWACLRRAFPDAVRDAREYEKCLTNVALVYGAGSETVPRRLRSRSRCSPRILRAWPGLSRRACGCSACVSLRMCCRCGALLDHRGAHVSACGAAAASACSRACIRVGHRAVAIDCKVLQ